MARINVEDVVGVYASNGSLTCMRCFEGDLRNKSTDDIITQHVIEDEEVIYFCDECKEAIG